jgi:hypothetical protein
MGGIEQAIKTAVTTLAVIWVLNQFQPTRQIVQTALYGA